MSTKSDAPTTGDLLRRELIRLARQQEELANATGAATPYWEPCPPSVQGHRAAAAALREAADRVVDGSFSPGTCGVPAR